MSADFVAGYVSGAVGIVIGNPLDILKTRIQAGPASSLDAAAQALRSPSHPVSIKQFEKWSALVRGVAAPILGYGALNAILFVTYNRSLALLNTGNISDWPDKPSPLSIWAAGALGGLATFVVSAPTELVKCRAQVSNPPLSSWQVTKEIVKTRGLQGLYLGGTVTSLRDSIGYGFYFWTYELSKRSISSQDDDHQTHALKVLLCGGLAGVATWASIFPLDVIKTRVQTYDLRRLTPSSTVSETQSLLSGQSRGDSSPAKRPSAFMIATDAYRTEGIGVFFRGIGICSARAFIVNAVQWAIYEWMMTIMDAKA